MAPSKARGLGKGNRACPPQPWPTHGWQYDEVDLAYDGSWADALNELGAHGWQVVAVIHNEDPSEHDKTARVLLMRPRDKQFRAPRADGEAPETTDVDDESEPEENADV